LRKLLFYLLLLATSSLPAQDAAYTAIADRLATYAQRAMAWDVEGLLDLTDPELFEVISRDDMARQWRGLRSDENLLIEVRNFVIDEIGEIVTYHGEAFSPVSCHHQIVFTPRTAAYRTPEFRSRLRGMLEKNYGPGSVRLSTVDHQLIVLVKKSMFAVRRGSRAQWYFIEYRPENAVLLDLLLPPVVRALVGLE
jgi:succinate dehydrogenase flavin-adding protein (antitoxin of CptAB toxin-antitoxin module)